MRADDDDNVDDDEEGDGRSFPGLVMNDVNYCESIVKSLSKD